MTRATGVKVLGMALGASVILCLTGCSDTPETPGGPDDGGAPDDGLDLDVGPDLDEGTGLEDGSASCPGDGSTDVAPPPPRPLADLTGPWQLFFDDALILSRSDLTRTYTAFEKYAGNPVMTATEPWEDSYVYTYGRVLPNEAGDGYRMWYSVLDFDDPDGNSRVLYATSSDGVSWVKPSLGIRAWSGNTDNNFFIPRDRPNHILSVLHTPWDPDPGCRYKFINFDGAYGALPSGYSAACSADGVHLVDFPGNPVLSEGVGDVGQFLWDPWGRQYLGYVKVNSYVAEQRRRSVGLTATTDFGSWPAPTLVLEPDAIDDSWVTAAGLDLATSRTHFYGVSVFPYQTMFLGFLWIFRAQDPPACGHDCEPYQGYIFGKIHVELVGSRDGVHWTRADGDLVDGRPAALSLGPAGAWDSMMLFTANHPLLEGDTIKMYYGGCNEDHGRVGTDGACAVGLATLRKDGFAALTAAGTPGSLTTRNLTGTEGALRINYRTSGSGWIRVEVQDEAGVPVPGYAESDCVPLTGDRVDQPVHWAAHDELPGYPLCTLRLRFVLQDASLFSFAAGDSVR